MTLTEHYDTARSLPRFVTPKGSIKRYGHMGWFAMMIEVDKILEAREASDGITPTTNPNEKYHGRSGYRWVTMRCQRVARFPL